MSPSMYLIPLFFFTLCTFPVFASNKTDSVIFDASVLSERDIDPSIANQFAHGPRFLPGENRVELFVNGNDRGRVMVRFDENGALCADIPFQRAAGLVSPFGYDESIACFDLRRAWPGSELQLEPGEGKVSLVVPQEALKILTSDLNPNNWQHGGIAGMLNYNAQFLSSFGRVGALNFGQLDTEIGFNSGDWIVRSRQTFTRFNGEDRFNHHAAYAQRSFVGPKKVLQAGQISLSNSMFGTGQVLGFQVFPESALTTNQGGAGLVEGVAQTQSVVEVRQSGALIYSTTVPAGPFRLQGFSLLNTSTDLVVTLTGINGENRQFIIPSTTLLARAPQISPGLSFGAGWLDKRSGKAPLVGTLAYGWQLTPRANLNAGVLVSNPYRAGSLNLDTSLFDMTRLNLRSTLAQDAEHGNVGTLLSASLSRSLSERLSVHVNGFQQTSGYRELSDALMRDDMDNLNSQNRSHYQWGGGINWSMGNFGNLSFSWARSTSFARENSDYLRGGWSRQFGRAYLGVSVEHNNRTRSNNDGNRLYVSFSMPLEERGSINSYLSTTKGGSSRAGVRYSNRTSQDRGWSISADRDLRNNYTSVSGNIDFVMPVSQLNASVSHDTNNYTSWSARASGSVVLHGKGVTLSPYRVTDTFGIARVGKESGVRLNTPAGPVWTDWRGYAVLPTLNNYRRSGIQVDTRSLEKNVDIANTWQETEMARGGVGQVDFEVLETRRVLVEAVMLGEQSLPYGASVFNDAGDLVTIVGKGGMIFVPDATPSMKLEVQSSGETLCTIKLNLPETTDVRALYENVKASCQ